MTKLTKRLMRRTALTAGALAISASGAMADQVIADDLIVQGSACIGLDCANGETFGFSTIIIKENNLRITARDTSTSASFPTTDWNILFNDSANGGTNKIAFENLDTGQVPFTVVGGSPTNSLVVDSQGDLGVGTATPAVKMHQVTGNTPTLRLEQNGSSGFTPQTWDLAGNEANFFIRDATNGSQLPFRIAPGADTNAISIAANNNVGMGIQNGTTPLHIRRTNAGGNLTMVLMENTQGRPRLQMTGTGNAAQTGDWSMSAGDTFVLQDRTTGDNVMIIDGTGNMTILGTLTEGSDKTRKMAIEPVNSHEILEKVRALPVASWSYKKDAEAGIRHIGPMAQDFYAAFGTGANDKGISSIDSSGVALAAIQALSEENAALKARLEALEDKIAD